MSVVWAATSLESGRFIPTETTSETDEMLNRFNQLRSRGEGYLEIHLPDDDFPQLTLGFRGAHAVVHLFSDPETISLLLGDGTMASSSVFAVPVMDDLAEFTGDFALDVDRAWGVVSDFAAGRPYRDLGEWTSL